MHWGALVPGCLQLQFMLSISGLHSHAHEVSLPVWVGKLVGVSETPGQPAREGRRAGGQGEDDREAWIPTPANVGAC